MVKHRRIAPRRGKMHEPDRLIGRSAAGTGDAGDGDGERGAGMGERAADHGAGDILAHRAVALDQPGGHAEHLALRGVRVGDEAAFEHVGSAGNCGEGGGEQAAGAGFGGGKQIAALAGRLKQRSGLRHDLPIDQKRVRHGSRTVAVAMAAMPSPRPMKPSPSLVVALMLTCPASRPRHSASFARIASR